MDTLFPRGRIINYKAIAEEVGDQCSCEMPSASVTLSWELGKLANVNLLIDQRDLYDNTARALKLVAAAYAVGYQAGSTGQPFAGA